MTLVRQRRSLSVLAFLLLILSVARGIPTRFFPPALSLHQNPPSSSLSSLNQKDLLDQSLLQHHLAYAVARAQCSVCRHLAFATAFLSLSPLEEKDLCNKVFHFSPQLSQYCSDYVLSGISSRLSLLTSTSFSSSTSTSTSTPSPSTPSSDPPSASSVVAFVENVCSSLAQSRSTSSTPSSSTPSPFSSTSTSSSAPSSPSTPSTPSSTRAPSFKCASIPSPIPFVKDVREGAKIARGAASLAARAAQEKKEKSPSPLAASRHVVAQLELLASIADDTLAYYLHASTPSTSTPSSAPFPSSSPVLAPLALPAHVFQQAPFLIENDLTLFSSTPSTSTSTPSTPSTSTPVSSSHCPPGRVIVIGAGVSGLTTAKALLQKGCEVVVLEANERIGGRVYSIPSEGLELGGQWVEGTNGNPLISLASALGWSYLPTGGDSRVEGGSQRMRMFDSLGGHISEEDKEKSFLWADQVTEKMAALMSSPALKGKDMSVMEAIRRVEATMDPTSLPSEELRMWQIRTAFPMDYSAEAEVTSVRAWLDYEENTFDGDDAIFPDGFKPLVDYLSEGVDVRLGHVVTEVTKTGERKGNSSVRVVTSKGTFEGALAVVTLPLGVLKKGSVKFTPPLSPSKTSSLSSLGSGDLEKVFLTFDRPFWPQEFYSFALVPSPLDRREISKFDFGAIYNVMFENRTHSLPTLEFFNGGFGASLFENLSDEEVEKHCCDILSRVFKGVTIPKPIKFRRTSWHTDPLFLGAYSYLPVGATDRDTLGLSKPDWGGLLLFAGEATVAEHYQCIDGAYLSGVREAVRVLEMGGV